jgi:hypothetical protein
MSVRERPVMDGSAASNPEKSAAILSTGMQTSVSVMKGDYRTKNI